MGGGSGNKGYKGDDAENMCGATLEPDPRYQGCCSNIFRPGKVLRDVLIGFLVVLAIAVVIAVLFVVCFYLLPDTESSLAVEESAFVGKPIEKETNFNDLNEVELTDDTRYDVRPDVVLENIRKDEEQLGHETSGHKEHHHVGPTPGHESEAEPTAESEPEPGSEPEPEPEGADHHDHMHKDDGMTHEHMPKDDEMSHEHMPEDDGMTHEHMEKEDEMSHVHMPTEGEVPHEHVHTEGEMPHEHTHTEGEMPHEHVHTEGEMPHDHTHTEGEMPHEHTHTEGEMPHEHTHTGGEMPHEQMLHEHTPTDGEMNPEHMHKESEMAEEHSHMEGEQGHEHMMDHENEGPAFAPSAPAKDEVFEVVVPPTLETTPAEHTVSVSSAFGPGASEGTAAPVSETVPPLFETFAPRSNETAEVLPGEGIQPELIVPAVAIKEVEAPVLIAGENSTTEAVLAGSCRPRRLEMCSDLPYGLTALPNWANDQNEEELNEGSLPFFRDVIVRSGCSPRARQYACGVLEPPCNSDGSIVPPCRTFCRSVAATCQEFIIAGYSLSDVFDCDRFPDSADPSVCFDMTQAAGDEVLVEGLSPLPTIPIDEENPSSPRELSPEESPVPDYPEVPLVEDVPIDPVPAFGDYPTGTEEYVTATQDYPTESVDIAPQDPSILVPLVTEEEVGLLNEEPSVLDDALSDAGTETIPEEALMTTESSSSPAEVEEMVEGVAGDEVSPNVPVIICDHENFLCHDGSDCVALTTVCDGFQQCTDGSDEFNCTHIDFSPVASSTNAAVDEETQTVLTIELGAVTVLPDEAIAEVTTEPLAEGVTVISSGCPELQCLDGTCLALSQLNDGINDCPDGTDEQDFGPLF